MIYSWEKEIQGAFRFERNTCILAGAGTGKTSALVEQYLALLSEGTIPGPLNVEEIVAITFTEKAAAEMKERIREEIEKRITAGNHEFGSITNGQKWQEIWKKLFGANITTIHSFCARLLRENPIEAGIDPGFGILDEREARTLLERVVEQAVISGVQEGDPHTIRLLSDYELRRPGTFGPNRLIESLISLLTNIRNEGISLDQVERQAQDANKQARERLPRAIRTLKETFTELKTALREEGKEDKFSSAREKWSSLERKLKQKDWDFEGLISKAIPDFLGSLKISGERARNIKDPVKRIRAILNTDDKGKGYEDNLPRLYAQIQSGDIPAALIKSLRDIEASYAEEKTRDSLLDFDDLQIHTRNLLRSSPRVRERYKRLYRAIMVDEFQDTNDIQREIIYYLGEDPKYLTRLKTREDYRGKIRLGTNRLFVVGDPKQSIYGFRGADVGVFLEVMEDLEQRGKKFFLRENRRSLPPLIDFTNALFSELMSAPGEFEEESHLFPVRSGQDGDGGVELLLVSQGDSIDEKRRVEARAIASRILQLVGKIDVYPKDGERRCAKFRDIAILFRAMTKSHIYGRELRRRNVPYYTVRGSGFYGCQEIRDMLNVLKALESNNAEISLAGFLRSPMVGVSDETLYRLRREGGSLYSILSPANLVLRNLNEEELEKIKFARGLLQELKAAKDRLTSAELIARVLEGTGYSAFLLTTFQGEQKVANLHKLIEVARDFERKESFTFRDFVRHLENLVNEESREQEAQIFPEGSDCVQLMSVHQAKGLEFPVVFVADLERSYSGRGANIVYSKNRGIAVRLREVTGGNYLETSLYDKVAEEARKKEEAEDKRLFYVAATRARDYLILSGPIFRPRSKDSWAAKLNDFLSDYSGEINSFLTEPEPSTLRLKINKPGQSAEGYMINLLLSKAERVEEKPREEPQPLIQEYPEIEELKSLTQPLSDQVQAEAERILTQACDFHPGSRREFSISATSLSNFMFCRRKFYYTEVLGLAEFPLTASKAGLSPMEAGSLVHRTLERLDFSLAGENLSHHIDELIRQDPCSLRAGANELKQMKKSIQAFVEGESGKRISHTPAVYRELPIMLKLSEDGFSLFIHGIADILFCEPGDKWTVMDYKYTAQKQENPEQYRTQLLIYALAASEALPEEVRVRAAIKFLKDHRSPVVDLSPAKEELMSFWQNLIKEGKELSQIITVIDEEFWDKNDRAASGECRQKDCQFRSRCYPNP
ncbi:MAG: UvrD-helicase domain-containing protein [Deltaproteobacteria bacterium]|nr:MAG: UvrD-helicase domain-containing protein [Deltaproteobacteria bacterium]